MKRMQRDECRVQNGDRAAVVVFHSAFCTHHSAFTPVVGLGSRMALAITVTLEHGTSPPLPPRPKGATGQVAGQGGRQARLPGPVGRTCRSRRRCCPSGRAELVSPTGRRRVRPGPDAAAAGDVGTRPADGLRVGGGPDRPRGRQAERRQAAVAILRDLRAIEAVLTAGRRRRRCHVPPDQGPRAEPACAPPTGVAASAATRWPLKPPLRCDSAISRPPSTAGPSPSPPGRTRPVRSRPTPAPGPARPGPGRGGPWRSGTGRPCRATRRPARGPAGGRTTGRTRPRPPTGRPTGVGRPGQGGERRAEPGPVQAVRPGVGRGGGVDGPAG